MKSISTPGRGAFARVNGMARSASARWFRFRAKRPALVTEKPETTDPHVVNHSLDQINLSESPDDIDNRCNVRIEIVGRPDINCSVDPGMEIWSATKQALHTNGYNGEALERVTFRDYTDTNEGENRENGPTFHDLGVEHEATITVQLEPDTISVQFYVQSVEVKPGEPFYSWQRRRGMMPFDDGYYHWIEDIPLDAKVYTKISEAVKKLDQNMSLVASKAVEVSLRRRRQEYQLNVEADETFQAVLERSDLTHNGGWQPFTSHKILFIVKLQQDD